MDFPTGKVSRRVWFRDEQMRADLLPFDRLYIGDYLRAFRRAPIRDPQSLYINLRFIMHDSDRYGYLSSNGSPIPPGEIADTLGLPLAQFESLLAELDEYHVLARARDGTIYCPQMVESARKAQVSAKSGRKGGGNPNISPPPLNPSDNDNDIDSSDPQKKSERPRQPRAENPLWDELCKAFGLKPVTSSEKSRVGRIVKEMREKGVNPAEIPVRLARYQKLMPKIVYTPEGLFKHWDACTPTNNRSAGNEAARIRRELAECEKTPELYEHRIAALRSEIAQLEGSAR